MKKDVYAEQQIIDCEERDCWPFHQGDDYQGDDAVIEVGLGWEEPGEGAAGAEVQVVPLVTGWAKAEVEANAEEEQAASKKAEEEPAAEREKAARNSH